MSGKYMGYDTIEEARKCVECMKDPKFAELSKQSGVNLENLIPLMEKNLEEAEKLYSSESSSDSSSTSLPEPADGETVTKTTVSKSKDGGESALEKAVEAAGGFGDEGEGGDEDEDIVDMSDEGAGNLLKVLQSKF